jgi:hypothetical protein
VSQAGQPRSLRTVALRGQNKLIKEGIMAAHTTPEQVALILELKAKNKPINVIAGLAAVSRWTVRRILKRYQDGS